MQRRAVPMVLLALAALTLAGCSGSPPPPHDALPSLGMSIFGLVQNESFAPVSGAQVSLRLTNLTATTDPGGLFSFTGLVLSPYLVDVVADGFANATLNAEPRDNVSLSFILVPTVDLTPEPVSLHFRGNLQCALEAFIISPSCDTLIDAAREETGTGPDVFQDISTFEAHLNRGWATVVIDADFDDHPGLEGLRITLQGRNDADQIGSYEKYGSFHDAKPFTTRIAPGETYPQGTGPVPQNATGLQFEVYPHGRGYHATCEPVTGQCPLGVGAGSNVQFDLYVTIFYGVPAPEGFTLLA